MKTNIEVEIRSFISQTEYKRLLKFFKSNTQLIKEDNQETIYFDCPQDLRIQKNDFTSKIWMKEGNLHDDCREEIEIRTERENFEKLQLLFQRLGYKEEIKWLRKRKEFDWNGIKVCLDFTFGYGYIIELEKLSTEKDKNEVLTLLRSKLKELEVTETQKEEFNSKYEDYKINWRKYIQ